MPGWKTKSKLKKWRGNGTENKLIRRVDRGRGSQGAAPAISSKVLGNNKRVYMTLEFVKAMSPTLREKHFKLWEEGRLHIEFDPRFDTY